MPPSIVGRLAMGALAASLFARTRQAKLAITAWNIAFAVVVVIWAFGWAGGKLLVERSYAHAMADANQRKAKPATS